MADNTFEQIDFSTFSQISGHLETLAGLVLEVGKLANPCGVNGYKF